MAESGKSTAADTYTSEIRISLVLYGGSSLVVYMNGVAQELLNMVRATAANAFPTLTGKNESPIHDAYRAAARVSKHEIDAGYKDLVKGRTAAEIVSLLKGRTTSRRLTIDVMSGASAGGLNAIFLARALLLNGEVDIAGDLLIQHGDILAILNEDDSDGDDDGHWPKSLLDGDRLYALMLDALNRQAQGKGLDEDAKPVAEAGAPDLNPLVDALDCFMALTDLRGVPVDPTVTLVHGENLQHKARAHLRYGTKQSYGAERNDFVTVGDGPPMEPFLTFVGRATSAHPAAFHPVQLARVAADLVDDADYPDFAADTSLWSTIIEPTHPAAPLETRWFSDGGDLDNKPFTYAIDPVEGRRATIPVDRKVIWVEPDPSKKTDAWMHDVAPGLGEITFGAYNLPRKEGTVGDLQQIERRNREAANLKESTDELFAAVKDDPIDRYAQEGAAGGVAWTNRVPQSPERRLYELERARDLLESLAEWCVSYHEAAPSSEEMTFDSVQKIVALHAHRDVVVGEDEVLPPYPEGHWPHRRLLVEHDIDYRLRRLNYIDQRLSTRQRDLADTEDSARAQLEAWRSEFNEIYLRIVALDRMLRGHAVNEHEVIYDTDLAPPQPKTDAASLTDFVVDLLDKRRATIGKVLSETSTAATNLIDRIGRAVETLDSAGVAGLDKELHKAWADFDMFDTHLLPRYGALRGELDQIEALRFSPSDITMMGPDHEPAKRLGGIGVGHFGAFFDERWRRNDIFWGRMDAADRIVSMLLPLDGIDALTPEARETMTEVQRQLVHEIQEQIIAESEAALTDIAALDTRKSGKLKPRAGLRQNDREEAKVVREKLAGVELDLSLAGEARRRNDWRTILRKVPIVLGEVIALGGYDPWADEPTKRPVTKQLNKPAIDAAKPTPEERRAGAARTGSSLTSWVQLIKPTTFTPWMFRLILFALGVAGAAGVIDAYGADHRELLFPFGGVAIGGALLWLAGKPGVPLRRRLPAIATLAPIVGAGLLLLGEPIGLLDELPEKPQRAYLYAFLMTYGLILLAAFTLLGRMRQGFRLDTTIMLVAIGAFAAMIGALITEWHTGVYLLGSLLTATFCLGLLAGLWKVQQRLDTWSTSSKYNEKASA